MLLGSGHQAVDSINIIHSSSFNIKKYEHYMIKCVITIISIVSLYKCINYVVK